MAQGDAIRREFDPPLRRCAYSVRLWFRQERGWTAKENLPRNRMHSEDGQSILETALSAMAVLALFLGVMEMCLALYTYHFVSEAAREGTRYAMVRGSSCSGLSACQAQPSDVQNYVRGLGFPGIVPANVTVTTTWPTTGSSCTPSSLPCNNPGNFVQVTVQYRFPLSIPFVPSSILPLTSTSKMAISQ